MKKLFNISLMVICFALSSIAVKAQTKQRPQQPKKPFPYKIEQIKFANQSANISLAGTLTYPKQGSGFPALILISGSGPQNRDSELLGHKPFWVIADHLSRAGYAVLRFDDRGVNKSGGVFDTSTTYDFAKDVESALRFLQNHKAINAKKIGLIGHSEGGIIAPIVAQNNLDVAFMILLAGSGMRGDSLLLLQKMMIELKMGIPESAIAESQILFGDAYQLITSQNIPDSDLKLAVKNHFSNKLGANFPESQINSISEQLTSKWFVNFMRLDPKVALRKVNCPVLVLNGEEDIQVPATENVNAIFGALKEGGNQKVEKHILPKLNHLFQECKTCQITEYEELEETFHKPVLDLITNWLNKTTK